MKKSAFIIALLLISSPGLLAQTRGDMLQSGSVYSKLGIGLPLDYSSSATYGMGLFGVSYLENFVPGVANPAHWGFTSYGMASGGINFQNIRATDFQNNSRNSLLTLNNFQAQMPLKQNKIGLAASFTPITQSRYQLINNKTRYIGTGASQDTLNYQAENIGSGGLNQLEMGIGWRINDKVAVGYGTSLVFASIDDRYNAIFESSAYQNVSFNYVISGLGWGNRFGAQVSLPAVFNEDDELDFGASVRLPVKLNSERVQKSEQTSRENPKSVVLDDGENLGKGDIHLPMSLSGGITYYAGNALAVALEGKYENWSDFKYEFDSSQEQYMDDRYKVGMGLRYFPFTTGSNKFLSRFKYRLGVSYDTGHLEIKGQPIETLMFSAGLGLLAPNTRANSNSSIDISIQYGFRGTKSQKLVKEQIWGLRLSLNLAELVFFRRKLQ